MRATGRDRGLQPVSGDGPPFAMQIRLAPLPWRPWGQAAIDEAVLREVPLAVLIGDSLDAWTAQWLNAMHADAEFCALLEAAFVPVAAERSDHPGLAALAQQVLGLVADAAGVPCLLALLPGSPPRALGAVPYGPLRDGEQRKGLARILLETAEGWRLAGDELRGESERLVGMLAGLPFALAGDGRLVPERVLNLAEAQLMGEAHALEGGFGSAPDGACALPRWPQPEKLRLLAALAARPGAAPSLRAHLERSLAALAAGGIRDQLHGGFHRASADSGWRMPLWEQRLADQARLAIAFLDGFRLTGQPLHRTVAEQSLLWAVRNLALDAGRWAAGRHAIAATAGGAQPGAFHAWSRPQCAAIVGEDGARILAERFALDGTPGPLAVRGPAHPRLPELVARLAAAREERAGPPLDPRDDLAAHGWLLAALQAAAELPRPEPELITARDALRARLAALTPVGRAGARAAIAYGLACAGGTAAGGWLPAAGEGPLPADDDGLVVPMPCDAEDTVDGPGAAGALALALVVLGRRAEALAVCRAHAGLLNKAPAVAPSLVLALAWPGVATVPKPADTPPAPPG